MWAVNSNDICDLLTSQFERLLENDANLSSPAPFNMCRDDFRDLLSKQDSRRFPQFGAVDASVSSILDLIYPRNTLMSVTSCTNDDCNKLSRIQQASSLSLRTRYFPVHNQNGEPITLQEWLTEWFSSQICRTKVVTSEHETAACDGMISTSLQLSLMPSVLFIELVDCNTH